MARLKLARRCARLRPNRVIGFEGSLTEASRPLMQPTEKRVEIVRLTAMAIRNISIAYCNVRA
jgi:hypothetical protein